MPRHCEDFAIWVRLGLYSTIKRIPFARAKQLNNKHLFRLGQTIKKWYLSQIIYIKYAQDLFNSQRFQEAYAVFDFLTPIDLWYPGLHYSRAVCLQLLGRNTDALLALKREFELHPDFEVPNPEFFGLERG